MSKFKRVSLVGSEELFRATRPEFVDETDEVATRIGEMAEQNHPICIE